MDVLREDAALSRGVVSSARIRLSRMVNAAHAFLQRGILWKAKIPRAGCEVLLLDPNKILRLADQSAVRVQVVLPDHSGRRPIFD